MRIHFAPVCVLIALQLSRCLDELSSADRSFSVSNTSLASESAFIELGDQPQQQGISDFVDLVSAFRSAAQHQRLRASDAASGVQDLLQSSRAVAAYRPIAGSDALLEQFAPSKSLQMRKLRAMWVGSWFLKPAALTAAAALAYQRPINLGLQLEHIARCFMMIKLKARLFIMQDKKDEHEDIEKYSHWLKTTFPRLNFLAMIIDMNVLESQWKRVIYGIMPMNRIAMGLSVLKLTSLYFDQLIITELKKVASTDDKAKAVLVTSDWRQKLAFMIELVKLKTRLFQWSSLFPAMLRALTLKARWRVANNRQMVYTLHHQLLLDVEVSHNKRGKTLWDYAALAPGMGDQQSQSLEIQDRNAGSVESLESAYEGKERAEKFEDSGAFGAFGASAGEKGPGHTVTLRRNRLKSTDNPLQFLSLQETMLLRDMPHPTNNVTAFLQTGMGTGIPDVKAKLERTPDFTGLRAMGEGAPHFATWGQNPVLGARILGIDQESFDPTTSGRGTPNPNPLTIEDSEAAVAIVKKATQSAMQAYLDYGSSPLRVVSLQSVIHSDVLTTMQTSACVLEYMNIDAKEKLLGQSLEKQRGQASLRRQVLYVNFGKRVLHHFLWMYATGAQARLQAIKDVSAQQAKVTEEGDKNKAQLMLRTIFYRLFPDYFAWVHSQVHLNIACVVAWQREIELLRQLMDYERTSYYQALKGIGFTLMGETLPTDPDLYRTQSLISETEVTDSAFGIFDDSSLDIFAQV